jgi:hypothetical protein
VRSHAPRSILAVAGIALAVAATLSAPPMHAGAQLAPRDQTDADIASAAQDYVLVWSEDRGAGFRLYGRRVRANGLPVGGATEGEWELTGPTQPGGGKGDQRWPALTDGLLVWSERAPGGSDYDLYAQRLFGNNRTKGQVALVHGGPGDQKQADVVPVAGRENEWLVVWGEDTRDAGDVLAVRLGVTLAPRGAVIDIAKGNGTAEDPTVGVDLTNPNYMLVLWTDDRKGNLDVYGARIAATGLPRGSATVGQFPVIASPENDYAAMLLTDPADGAPGDLNAGGAEQDARNLLLWTHDDVADGPDVLAIRLRNNGFAVGKLVTVAAGPGTQKWPAAALKPGSSRTEWLTVWHADPLGTLDIFGVEIGSNGLARRNPRPLAMD